MKIQKTVCMGLLALLVTPVLIEAETEVEFSGQVRIRNEFDNKEFDPLLVRREYTYLRTRLAAEAVVDGNTHVFIQLQDSRRFGDNNASGTLNDLKNIDLHQGYVQIDRLWLDGWGMKAGRFELGLGNQRVFGTVGWSNVGRSWEGAMSWYENPGLKLTGLWLKRMERDYSEGNADFEIFGLYGNFRSASLDVFGFYEYDASTLNLPAGMNRLDRVNIGAYFHRLYQRLDLAANGVYQFGKQPTEIYPTAEELDIAAFMVTFEAGYNFHGRADARLAVGIDYASGDDDGTDDKFQTYDNLYYTAHKFNGYMDYFVPARVAGKPYENAGLVDLILRGELTPATQWKINGDFHYFMTAVDYVDFADMETKDVGMEIDLSISTTSVAGVNISAGGSAFFPKESFAGVENPDPGYWLYSMVTADF
jgi:hypothetical protein